MIKSFSLVEIMVTIAIVAVLVSIAVPVYAKYINQARIAEAVEVLQTLNNNAIAAFNEGSLGSTFTYNNVSLSSTVADFSYMPVVRASYLSPTTLSAVNKWAFCVYVTGLNFSGYVAPVSGSDGTYARVCSQVQSSNGVYSTTCGAWDGSSADILIAQLPTNCNCASVSTGAC